ncbi:MAG: hypothetical protein FWD37_01735 [Methanomassiliicoccaceae archaeon]|nr:hypothetical protein [Methanomassiliicoccaceae archaeon]
MTLKDDILEDFSPKNGSLLGAFISFLITTSIFVIIPFLIFNFLFGAMADIDIEELKDIMGGIGDVIDGMWDFAFNLMKYAIPLVLLSIPAGFYRPGSYARIPFKMLYAMYLAAWMWIASRGGIFEIPIDDSFFEGLSQLGLSIGIDVRYIVYVTVMICFAKMFLAFSEFGGHRKKYLEKIEKKKDKMSERKARRLSE